MTTPVRIDGDYTVEIPIEDEDRILCFTMEVVPTCVACGRPLSEEQIKDAPQFMTDALCHPCHEWLGKALVGWLGADPNVAQLQDNRSVSIEGGKP